MLDEPLSGLDVNAAILIKDLIAALAAEGRTIVYSSHVLDVVEKICDRALIIHKGNVIAQGTPDELKSAAGQPTLEEVFRHLTSSGAVDPARVFHASCVGSSVMKNALRGARTARLLRALDIDPKQFWLLIDLFKQLSKRGESTDQLGHSKSQLKIAGWLYLLISAPLTFAILMAKPQPSTFFLISAFMTGFLLLNVLVSEAGNSLINPTEGFVLAHQPINGATYTAAKLSHLFRIVVHLVVALNILPALGGLRISGAPWFYPLGAYGGDARHRDGVRTSLLRGVRVSDSLYPGETAEDVGAGGGRHPFADFESVGSDGALH